MRPDAIDWNDRHEHLTLSFPPNRQFHRILRRWVIIMLIAPVLTGIIALALLQGPWRRAWRSDHADALLTFAAAELRGLPLVEGDPGARTVVNRLAEVPGVEFAAVLDAQGGLVVAAGHETSHLREMVSARTERLPSTSGSTAPSVREVDALNGAIVHELSLDQGTGGAGHRLVVRLRDVVRDRAFMDGVGGLVAGAALTSVVLLPCLLRRLTTWGAEIGLLHAAIRRLTHGARPQPVPVVRDDEVSYLAIAFNDMAARIIAHRDALMTANSELEARVASRTAELQTAVGRLEELSLVDDLTKLPNRRAMSSGLRRMLARAVESNSDLIVLAVDLDGFKTVNDTLGHAAGDELLCVASDLFRTACGDRHMAARIGGDEFVLVMQDGDLREARQVAGKLIEEFGHAWRARRPGAALPKQPSMSIGIASRRLVGTDDIEALLRAADDTLYEVKRSGKSRAEVCPPGNRGTAAPPTAAPAA